MQKEKKKREKRWRDRETEMKGTVKKESREGLGNSLGY